MGKFKTWVFNKYYKDMIIPSVRTNLSDASSSGQRETLVGIIKKIGLRFGDISSKDYEEPEFDLKSVKEACLVDAYVRQGVDKYVDQIFKEGYKFYGQDENIVAYIKLRLAYIAEASDIPTEILLTEIVEDVVTYANSVVAKSRSNDPNAFPQGATVTGLDGKDAVAGYFPINPTTLKVKRDKNGTVKGWQQEIDGADAKVKLNPEDVVHIFYKRERGNAFGTPFLIPVLNDVRALREAEDNVLKMMYRNIYPFLHVKVGDDNKPGSTIEVDNVKDAFEDMDIEGGLVTSNRVNVDSVETNKTIDAEPYLRYMEDRVFSGMGIPAILFGRGGTANRSTGDNMSSEMSDRIRAIQKTIETFINFKIVKELLLEGGYDPLLNPDQEVKFAFNHNNVDLQIKNENHAIFKYEHNAITEDEMRELLGKDPITDRSKMFQTLITQANAKYEASLNPQTPSSTSKPSSSKQTGTKSANNRNKPQNQHKTKPSPKKTTNAIESLLFYFTDLMIDKIIIHIEDKNIIKSIVKDYIITSKDILINSKVSCYDINETLIKFGSTFEKEINDINEEFLLIEKVKSLFDDLLDEIKIILKEGENDNV